MLGIRDKHECNNIKGIRFHALRTGHWRSRTYLIVLKCLVIYAGMDRFGVYRKPVLFGFEFTRVAQSLHAHFLTARQQQLRVKRHVRIQRAVS